METATFHISGMACGGCADTVRQALLAVDGVAEAKISHVEGMAEIVYDPVRANRQQIEVAVRKAGYSVF